LGSIWGAFLERKRKLLGFVGKIFPRDGKGNGQEGKGFTTWLELEWLILRVFIPEGNHFPRGEN